MMHIWLSAAGVSGFLCVALGAFGAHGLKHILDAYGKDIYETAVLYQMFHTLALLGVGLLQRAFPKSDFNFTGWCFVIGMILFSGSLYLLSLTQIKWLGAVTPLGGVAFLSGWAALVRNAVKLRHLS